jgi:hypothetical protein
MQRKTNEEIMKKYLPQIAFLSIAVTGVAAAMGPPDVNVPDEIASKLKLYVGHWTYETTAQIGGKPVTSNGALDCSAAAGGIGVLCTTHETGPVAYDSVQLIGYDSGTHRMVLTTLNNHGVVEILPTTWHGNSFSVVDNIKDPASGKLAKTLVNGGFGSEGNSIKQHIVVHVGDATVADVTTIYHRVK